LKEEESGLSAAGAVVAGDEEVGDGPFFEVGPLDDGKINNEDACGREVLEGTSGEAVAKGGPGGVVADEHRDLDFVGELASVVDDFTRRSPIKRINHLNLFLRKPELGRN
jgi:hypothetical protein